jgi:hypothetical protein
LFGIKTCALLREVETVSSGFKNLSGKLLCEVFRILSDRGSRKKFNPGDRLVFLNIRSAIVRFVPDKTGPLRQVATKADFGQD